MQRTSMHDSIIKRLYVALTVIAVVVICEFQLSSDPLDGFLIIIGVTSLCIVFLKKTGLDVFSPMTLFALYYAFVYLYFIFLQAIGLERSTFLTNTTFYHNIDYIYTAALFVCVISFWCVFAGFFLVSGRHSTRRRVRELGIPGIGGYYFSLFAYILFILGLSNFIFNIYIFTDGSIIKYYGGLATRSQMFRSGGTTLFYQLAYVAAYMLFIRDLDHARISYRTRLVVILSVLMFASSGRIIQTLFYALTFVILYYYNRGEKKLNNKMLMLGAGFVIAGLIIYSLRLLSSIYLSTSLSGELKDFIETRGVWMSGYYYVFQKGNVPNIPLLMKIIDSWAIDIGYQYGKTLLFPFYGFVSPDLNGLIQMPAVVSKETWYAYSAPIDIPTGTLPVTGMGEMYLNFGWFGVTFGMFMFGMLGGIVKRLQKIRGNIYLIFYSKFSLFFMLYVKGEFNNFNLFWMIFPSVCIILIILCVRSLTLNSHKITYAGN